MKLNRVLDDKFWSRLALLGKSLGLLGLLVAASPIARAAEPAEPPKLAVRGEVHRTFDDRVIVSVPIAAGDERLLVARGFRACRRPTGNQESATVCNGRAYHEYAIDERPLVLDLVRASAGQPVVLDLVRTKSGKLLVVNAHR